MLKRYQIDAYKRNYPQGTRVELGSMDGESDMPGGLQGTVDFVDDAGQIHVSWDNGRTLAICPEVDAFRRLSVPSEDSTLTMGGM